jgi:ribosome biogenesis protein ENP2
MHGYLIDMNAYKKAKEASQTSVVEDYRRRKVKEKLEEERQTNFVRRKARKLPKVNKELASRLQSDLTLDGSEEPKKARFIFFLYG